jgi:ATP-dependent NAD(P)H-hydrate dehydratase
MSALRVGADISHVFCTEEAGTPIKAYSPDLIVHPVLRRHGESLEQSVERVVNVFPRLHALVEGPGLGREEKTLAIVTKCIEAAKEKRLPILLDGDGLFLVSQKSGLIANYERAVLTPNPNEFKSLLKALQLPENDSCESLARKLGVTVVQKGEKDIVSNGKSTITVDEAGSPRRCGGQGDLVAGAIGAFLCWAYTQEKSEHSDADKNLLAGAGGCLIGRHLAARAFSKNGRSMIASDMMDYIPEVMESLFPKGGKK